MSAACGRADLVRALAVGGPAGLDAAARLLGYQPTPAPNDRQDMRLDQRPPAEPPLPLDPAPPAPSAQPEQPDVSFWQPIARWFLDETAGEEPSEDAATPAGTSARRAPVAWSGRPATPPSWPSLEPWRRLLPRLRGHVAEWGDGGELDIDAAILAIAQAQELKRPPRRKRRRWGPAIQVIDDRSRRLTPFWRDQDQVCAWLATLYPRDRFDQARWFDGARAPIRQAGLDIDADYRPPPPGVPVLVLGDLGALASDRRCVRLWLEFGRRLRAAGCVPVALTPCPSARWPKPLRRVWRMVEWERRTAWAEDGARDIPAERAMTERLLRLLSPAIRVEPGLLRSVRRALLPDADAGVEADFWQDKALASHSSVAAALDPDAAAPLRQAFEAEDAGVRRLVLDLLRRWRFGLSADVWFEEVVSLGADSRALLPETELTEAADRFDQLSRWAPTIADPLMRAEMVHGLRRLFDRLPSAIDADARVGAAMGRLRRMTEPEAGPPRPVQLRQIGDDLLAVAGEEAGPTGSLLAQVWTTDGRIAVSQELADARDAFWKSGKPPSWARDWGWDEFGAWVTFGVDSVTQRLRWIPPGRFLMGSPEGEPGRKANEGPQHEVTLSRGYWLFDTACTQALWQTVMGRNPSRFKGDDMRPVDSVGWNDAQGFMIRLTARAPGLGLVLPTEAQWEYACRAGTTTPFSFGDSISADQVNYEGNYPYRDSPRGLYRKHTVPVASLPPNPWGLYEMHGNLWEWCADGRRRYEDAVATDPRGPAVEGDDSGVLRGGSWYSFATRVRSGFRSKSLSEDGVSTVGFRCALASDAAEPMAPALPRLAERRGTQGTAGGAVLRVESGIDGARCPLPQAPAFHIRTDREELLVERITRPAWADALGCDRFGLWTEIVVEPEGGGESVTQRLRWIPPGRFLMGSPEDEPERGGNEGPQHEVTLSRGYWLFDTACTQALWRAVMGKNPSHFTGDDRRPVECVSWNDVQGFLARLNARVAGLDLGLPTEAQWEHACRAGTTTPFSFGATITPEQVNYDGGSPYADGAKGLYRERTVPVRSLPPNAWGLYEMHGNLWEWCADGLRDYTAEAATDPCGPESAGVKRVLRGGSWFNFVRSARAAYRYWCHPDDRLDFIGFRCARVQA